MMTVTALLTGVLLAACVDVLAAQEDKPEDENAIEFTGTAQPWTGTDKPWTGTNAPSTGTANAWTGTAWTGTAKPATGTVVAWTGTNQAWTGTNQPLPDPGKPKTTRTPKRTTYANKDQCYRFSCTGQYEECYNNDLGASSFCRKGDGFCKVSLQETKGGRTTVKTECVPENCEFTHKSNSKTGDLTFSCCNTHLCNDQNLLRVEDGEESAACVTSTCLLHLLVLAALASRLLAD